MSTLAIQRLLADLHAITGLSVHLYDDQRRGLIHYGQSQPLCGLTHISSDALERCHAFDAECYEESARRRDVFVKLCPFGFYTAICAIFDSDKLLGFLQLDGGFAEGDDALHYTKQRALAHLPNEEARITERLSSSPRLPESRLAAIPSLLRAVCSYIVSNNLFPLGQITLGILIKRYIKHNLQGKLSLADIGASLHCSKATLTETFRREFGITIVQYINRVRLERAEALLANTELPIREIAEECGFSGAEYFSSLFKRERGISPLVYRRAAAKKV